MSSKSGGHDANQRQERGRGGHEVLKGRASNASHIKQSEKFADCRVVSAGSKNRVETACDTIISFKPTSSGGCGGQDGKLAEFSADHKGIVKRVAKKLADQNDREDRAGPGQDGGCAAKEKELEEAKRGREGLFNKVERQPNRRGGLKEKTGENRPIPSENLAAQNSSEKLDGPSKTTSNGGQGGHVNEFARVSRKGFFSKDAQTEKFRENIGGKRGTSVDSFFSTKYDFDGESSGGRQPGLNFQPGLNHWPGPNRRPGINGGDGAKKDQENSAYSARESHKGYSSKDGSSFILTSNHRGSEAEDGKIREDAKSRIDDTNRSISFEPEAFSSDKRLSPLVDSTFAVATEKIRENSYDPGIFCESKVDNRPKSSEKLTQNSSLHRSNSTKYAQKVDKFRQNNGGNRRALENNVEIFRKAFGDGHYFVKAGREGLFSKNDVHQKVDPADAHRSNPSVHAENSFKEAKRSRDHSENDFVKAGQEGLFSNHNRSNLSNYDQGKIREIDAGNKNALGSNNVNAHRSNLSKFDQKIAHDQPEIFREVNSYIEAKRGREGFIGTEERQPNRNGGPKENFGNGRFVRVSRKGFSNKFRQSNEENSMEKFRQNNVEIFRKAFGDSHYLTKAEHSRFDSYSSRVSRKGISTYAQSVKFSENVQKGDFSRTQGRVSNILLPFAVYVSNSKVKLSGKEYLSIRTELINAFMRESQDTQVLLVNECEKRVFNSERGAATFYTKSKFAQDFTIRVINEKLSSQGITARGPRSEPRPNLHVVFPLVLTKVQAKPVDIIKEAILLNAKIDCKPIIITDRPNPKSTSRILSFVLPEDKLGQLQSWTCKNNAKKLTLFTESLHFWTSKKTVPTAIVPEAADAVMVPNATPVELSKNNKEEVADSTPVVVPILISEEPSKNNVEEIVEVTDAPVGAQSDFVTTETEISDSMLVVPISIPKEASKNNAEETQKILDESVEATDTPEGAGGTEKTSDESLEANDDPEGAQGATTINTDALKAEVTKVAKATKVAKVTKATKAKTAGKKGAYQTSPGSSIAKNRPRRACTLKSTSLGQPTVEAFRKVLTDSLVSQKRMSDFFPKK
jgi:hypothetical protein